MINCLAFDLGAGSGRLAVSEYDGHTVQMRDVHRFENGAVEIGRSLYWDVGMIWDEFMAGFHRAITEYPALSSVGIDSFSNDFALLSKNGDIISPIHCYRDPRTLRNEDAIYAQMSKESLYRISGNQIAPFNTLMQLAAMSLEGRGELLREADTLLFLPDYFNFMLTGARRTERTIASVSQMYDHRTKDWSDFVLERFGIERRMFATFVDAGAFVGEINLGALGAEDVPNVMSASGVKRRPLVCAVPEHDTASAFMAAQADESTLVVSSGTWTIVGCETAAPVITDYGFRHNIANEEIGRASCRERV